MRLVLPPSARVARRIVPLAAVLALSACATATPPGPQSPRESVSTAEWLVEVPRARVAAAFEAVRDSLGIAPLADVESTAEPMMSGNSRDLRGQTPNARVTVGLADEGASTRLHLRMEADGPAAPMEHLRWATQAIARLGAETRAVSVPAAIWPASRASCLGISPFVGTPAQGWRAPSLAEGPEPVYTTAARRAGVEGRVLLRLAVDERGGVACVEVVSGLPHGLSQSAIAAAREWRFRPATQNGARTAVTVATSVTFPAASPSMMPSATGPANCPREDPNCRL